MAAAASVALMHRITNVRLPGPLPGDGGQSYAIDLDEQGLICRIDAMGGVAQQVAQHEAQQTDADWNGDWLSPRGVDLQINGGLGLAFPELTSADLPLLEELLDLLWRDGVEAIAPTLVTCGIAPLRQALAVLRQARQQHRPGRCQLLGAHLEGPFLAEARRGAHPREHLASPSLEALEERIGGFETEIALVTLAPELEGAAAVIGRLRELGISVALGHSAATAEQASTGFDQGVAMLTHTFNAMPGLHHRAPGPVGALLGSPPVALGLIADGVHVAPAMAALLQRLFPEQVVLVSDALAPYGLPAGQYPWDARTIQVERGSCRLEDGTLAGTTLTLLEGAIRLAGWTGDAAAAIRAATVLPRRVLGQAEAVEQQLLGQPLAHTLRWSQAPTQPLTWCWNG